ncbi:hypothetical protein D3C76_1816970 [compost metagenome]
MSELPISGGDKYKVKSFPQASATPPGKSDVIAKSVSNQQWITMIREKCCGASRIIP